MIKWEICWQVPVSGVGGGGQHGHHPHVPQRGRLLQRPLLRQGGADTAAAPRYNMCVLIIIMARMKTNKQD